MITKYEKFNESVSNYDLTKLTTIVKIEKDANNWIYFDNNMKPYYLPIEDAGKLTIINDKLQNFVNSGKPITKYFELDGDKIIYVANFTVDGVILKDGRVYLIERKDGQGWALPGGFIDRGETPEQAVVRELNEETKLKPEDIASIEPLKITKANDAREINFFTYPFVIKLKSGTELSYADDAINSKWFLVNRAIQNNDLAFSHHIDILKMVDY